jgi:hypothetical protein
MATKHDYNRYKHSPSETRSVGEYNGSRYLLDGIHVTFHSVGKNLKAKIHDNHMNIYEALTFDQWEVLERKIPRSGPHRKIARKAVGLSSVAAFRDVPQGLQRVEK